MIQSLFILSHIEPHGNLWQVSLPCPIAYNLLSQGRKSADTERFARFLGSRPLLLQYKQNTCRQRQRADSHQFHPSAYTTDPTVAESQLKMPASDITAEYEKEIM